MKPLAPSSTTLLFHCLAICLLLFTGCHQRAANEITIATSEGDIVVVLHDQAAPKTCAAFRANMAKEIYTNGSFYRSLNADNQPMNAPKSFFIQGGAFSSKSAQLQPFIHHESTQQTGLKHLRGTVSMARFDTGTARTEFFICLEDQPGFDYGGINNADGQGYAVFGQVKKGWDAINRIAAKSTTGEYIDAPVNINWIR